MDKPVIKVLGEDGNIFGIIAKAQRALKEQGRSEDADEVFSVVSKQAESYEEALDIIQDYVEFI